MEAGTAQVEGIKRALKVGGPLNLLRSDEVLIDRFCTGDEVSFSSIYARHYGRVFAICLGVLGSREDAQDAAQEVFATAAGKLRAGAQPENFKPWLSQVARNAAIDIARSRKPVSEEPEENEMPASIGVAQVAEQRSEMLEIMGGLRELPEQQRSALVMREVGGYSYGEIAHVLGVDETAVRGLISRARISLRTHRESQSLDCVTVRELLAQEMDGRRRPATVRRHLKTCSSCREVLIGYRSDQAALRAIAPPIGIALAFLLFRPRGALAFAAAGKTGSAAKVTAVASTAAVAVGGGVAVLEVERVSNQLPQIAIAQQASAAPTPALSTGDSTFSVSSKEAAPTEEVVVETPVAVPVTTTAEQTEREPKTVDVPATTVVAPTTPTATTSPSVTTVVTTTPGTVSTPTSGPREVP